jgi:hypothetical protein
MSSIGRWGTISGAPLVPTKLGLLNEQLELDEIIFVGLYFYYGIARYIYFWQVKKRVAFYL